MVAATGSGFCGGAGDACILTGTAGNGLVLAGSAVGGTMLGAMAWAAGREAFLVSLLLHETNAASPRARITEQRRFNGKLLAENAYPRKRSSYFDFDEPSRQSAAGPLQGKPGTVPLFSHNGNKTGSGNRRSLKLLWGTLPLPGDPQTKLELPWIERRGWRARFRVKRVYVSHVEAVDQVKHVHHALQLHALVKADALG